MVYIEENKDSKNPDAFWTLSSNAIAGFQFIDDIYILSSPFVHNLHRFCYNEEQQRNSIVCDFNFVT
jgi:hypothetical protein